MFALTQGGNSSDTSPMGVVRRLAWRIGGVGGALLLVFCPSLRASEDPLLAALGLLKESQSGLALIQAAESRWEIPAKKAWSDQVQFGPVSRTDAVLTRELDPRTGREKRERIVTIFLKRGQSPSAVALDLAHELTHALAGQSWDPYDPELTAGKYIRSAIEGPGGEVDAVMRECQIEQELAKQGAIKSRSRCARYRAHTKEGPSFDRTRVLADFYRVGEWRTQMLVRLGSEAREFRGMTADKPTLYSSTGNAPYPVALYMEFSELNRVACDNTKRRMSRMGSASPAVSRAPGSVSPDGLLLRSERFLERRCQNAF